MTAQIEWQRGWQQVAFAATRSNLAYSFLAPNGAALTAYAHKPRRFLERLYFNDSGNPVEGICCAGFELKAWRCVPFAEHLIEWLPEYALPEDELAVTHANMYVKLKKAAVIHQREIHEAGRGWRGHAARHLP